MTTHMDPRRGKIRALRGTTIRGGTWIGSVARPPSGDRSRPSADHGYRRHDQVQVVVDPHARNSVQRDVLSSDGGDRDAVHADVCGLSADFDPDSVETLAGCVLHGDRRVRGPVRYGAGVRAVADLYHVLPVAAHYEVGVPGARCVQIGAANEDA